MFNHESPPIIVVVVVPLALSHLVQVVHIGDVVASKAISVATAGVIFAAHGALLSSVDVMSLSEGSDI